VRGCYLPASIRADPSFGSPHAPRSLSPASDRARMVDASFRAEAAVAQDQVGPRPRYSRVVTILDVVARRRRTFGDEGGNQARLLSSMPLRSHTRSVLRF
jgi:hypothetical protein